MTQQPFRQLMTAGQIVRFTKRCLLKMRRFFSRAQTSRGGDSGEDSFITHSDDSFPPKSQQFAVQPWATP